MNYADLQAFVESDGEPDLCPCGKGYVGHAEHVPIPDCYGCLGTGQLQWAGVPKSECYCRYDDGEGP